jgi:hypothetical protein
MFSTCAEHTAAATRSSPEFVTDDALIAEYIFVVGASLPDLAKALRLLPCLASGPGTCRCSAGDRRGHAKATHLKAVLGWTGWAHQKIPLEPLAEIISSNQHVKSDGADGRLKPSDQG